MSNAETHTNWTKEAKIKRDTEKAAALLLMMNRFEALNVRLASPDKGQDHADVVEGKFTVSSYIKGLAEIAEALEKINRIDSQFTTAIFTIDADEIPSPE